MSQECNGWSNYATWRVWGEILLDIEFDEIVSAGDLEDIVANAVFDNIERKDIDLMYDYANAFLYQVNYQEIANGINEGLALTL